MQDRGENVMNALLFFLEELGLSVSVARGKWGNVEIQASLFDGSAGFAVEQESGRMRLRLFGGVYTSRSSWTDGRRQLVEECFADFASQLIYAIALECGHERA